MTDQTAENETAFEENEETVAPLGGDEGLDPVAVLESELAQTREQMLRLAAEMENLRKRTEREVKDAKAYAVSAFARDMLPVGDNLARALAAAPEADTDALKGFVDGVAMTERELLSVLERHGITRIDPLGEKFDPNLHQAMFEGPSAEHPAGHVFAVAQAGFRINDRVLRPALVGVSKGAPAA